MTRPGHRAVYFALMGSCVLLIVLAWNVVRLWSVTAAVVMSAVAAVIPPVAVIVGSAGLDETIRNRERTPRRPPGPDE